MPLFNANIDLDNNQLQNAVVHSGSTKPSSGLAAGQIFYDTDSNQLQIYTGSDWEGVVTETKDATTITDVTSILNTSLVVGRDATDQIKFSTNNQIIFRVDGGDGVIFKGSGEIEATSLDISGNIDIDGTANLDAVDIDGVVNFAAVDHVMQNGANINDPSDNLLIGFATNAVTLGPTTVTSTLTIDSDIIHKDDTNNKISFGTDTQSFETGGTARINISDSGLQIGSGARVTTIENNDSLGTSDTKLATQGNVKAYVDANTGGNITSLGTISQDTVTFTSSNANDPNVVIKNTANDTNGARLTLTKDKGAAGADGDEIGEIRFVGDDAGQTITDFGNIQVTIGEADNTDEAGVMALKVASSDGTTTGLTSGLVLTGHKTSDYVDVTLGNGSSSTVTVAGNLTVSGTTTTVNSTTVSVADPIFELGASGSDDNLDRGIKMKYNSSGAKIAFMGFDDSTGKFTMIPDATDSSSVFSGTAGTLVMSTFEGNVTGNVTGDVEGDVTGNVSGTAATVTGAAQTNITSLGTLTALNVDNININGNTISSTDSNGDITITPNGTGEVNIAAGNLNYASTAVTATGAELNLIDGSSAGTIVNSKAVIYGSSGEVNATTLQIGGTSITSTAAELNIMDGDTGATSTTIVDADRVVVNDDGTMKQVTVAQMSTYYQAEEVAAREKVFILDAGETNVASTDNITYNVTHNFSSRNVMVEVYRNGSNSGNYQTVYVDVTRHSDDVVKIVFGSARTAGDYTAILRKIG